jgi:hypothetical protein
MNVGRANPSPKAGPEAVAAGVLDHLVDPTGWPHGRALCGQVLGPPRHRWHYSPGPPTCPACLAKSGA